ncbi:Putative peptidase C12, ubiquitin carboxyl-terminal hydrolase [Septoria linicola]|uniref:Ubiquitin carboxyl-terminal hydrolase n=1 Tax=Septoria linicola TaxID=215465 RepID=A0A9Q9B1A1_9PEZI|nr:Putative peptidase C12, ubiquitin carboxyl-terminal hydrolase [Septoria linicola]
MAATSTPGVYINPNTNKKTFVPLENNPEVFNDLIKRLGVTSKVGFYDVYGIEPDLLSMVPRPVHALIFISPAPVWNNVRKTYDGYDGNEKHVTYDAAGDGEPVMWFRQTIGHACGLYSLVHAVGNGSGKDYILKDSLVDRLLKQAKPLKRIERADVLYNSKELEEAHMASAVQGDSIVPSATEPVGFHFITFTKGDDSHLWELEGCWDPIDRGALDESEDMLSERAIELGVGKYVKLSEGNLEFSIIAMCTRPDDE